MLTRIRDRIRKLKGRNAAASFIVPVLVALLSAAAAMLAVDNLAFLTNAERFLADLQVAGLTPAEPQDPDIVIVAITEDTLRQFPYRAPVDREFVAELLETISAHDPRAIGVDLLFDQPTEEAKDKHLRQTLRGLSVPLVVSYMQIVSVVTEEQKAFLDEFVPAKSRGLANLATDQFDVVRRVYPGAETKDGYVQGFSRAIATKLGVNTPAEEVPIIWHGRPDSTQDAFS